MDGKMKELSLDDMYNIEAGDTLGNALIFAGGLVALGATGPVAVGVGVAVTVLGFCDAQGW